MLTIVLGSDNDSTYYAKAYEDKAYWLVLPLC